MWIETTRRQYHREDLRYASDMTDAEWTLIAPHLPAARRLGRPRRVALRAVVEALLYLLRTASPWRLLPRDFPNRSTVQRYFYAWRRAGLWKTINVPAAAAGPRAGRSPGQPVRRVNRQPIGQDDGKRRTARV
jgi:transposase